MSRLRRAAGLAAFAVLLAPAGAHAATCLRRTVPAAPPAQDVGVEQTAGYLGALDAASDRVRTGVLATTAQGRAVRYALISAPRNLSPGRLAAITARARAARAGTGSIAPGDPAIVWIDGGVHPNEPSGIDADLQLAQSLAEGRSCAELSNLLVVVVPLQNPDGRAADTRTNSAGFDLNRDWFARTQPETDGKVALLEQMPPVAFADQHEEDGTGFFFPPNADPIHHEISGQALGAIDAVFGPALASAFRAHGRPFVNGDGFDLFFMGYGDTVPTTLFGAAGMTFEKGGAAPVAQRVGDHLLAAQTVLATAEAHRRSLQRGWSAQWRTARAQGAAGTLQPNRVITAGAKVERKVPDRPVFAYLLRADAHGADAERLVARLRSVGVRVRVLRQATTLPAYRAYGSTAAASATLPKGTWVVPMAQTQKHWIQALLGQDAFVPFPYFYDVSAWCNPLLMGLQGGWSERALPGGATAPAPAAVDHGPARGAAAYDVDLDSAGAGGLVLDALRAGATASRRPVTGATVLRDIDVATLRRLAAVRRTTVTPDNAAPVAGLLALRAPKVAILADLAPVITGRAGHENSGVHDGQSWMRWLLRTRLGLDVTVLGDADLAAGALSSGAFTTFVVPDGSTPQGALGAAALAQIGAFVRGGGTYVGVRTQGLAVARAAGISTTRQQATTDRFVVPGAAFTTTVDRQDPLAWGEPATGVAFDTSDPIFAAGTTGATDVLRYRARLSGYAAGTGPLLGSAALIDAPTGAGRTVLFAFDPSFRGYAEGEQRLLVNALLAPTTAALGAPVASAASARRPVRTAALRVAAHTDVATGRVSVATDGVAVLRAHRPAGGRVIADPGGGATLLVPNPLATPGEDLPWVRPLLRALHASGVRPTLVAL